MLDSINRAARRYVEKTFPYQVDLVCPEFGYEAAEDVIAAWLTPRNGTFTIYRAFRDNEPVARYCFQHEADARAFRAIVPKPFIVLQ